MNKTQHHLIDITAVEVGGEMYCVAGWGWSPDNRSMTPNRVLADDGSDFHISDVTASITNDDGDIQQHQQRHGDLRMHIRLLDTDTLLFGPLTGTVDLSVFLA